MLDPNYLILIILQVCISVSIFGIDSLFRERLCIIICDTFELTMMHLLKTALSILYIVGLYSYILFLIVHIII